MLYLEGVDFILGVFFVVGWLVGWLVVVVGWWVLVWWLVVGGWWLVGVCVCSWYGVVCARGAIVQESRSLGVHVYSSVFQ